MIDISSCLAFRAIRSPEYFKTSHISLFKKPIIEKELYYTKKLIANWYNIPEEKYPYFYLTHGITDGLNHVLENKKFQMWENDYTWPKMFYDSTTIPDFSKPSELFYVSNPSSINGRYIDIPTDVSVILDLAYVTAAKKQEIDITDNIETILVGLSKGLGLETQRIGAVFSKTIIQKKEALQELGYFDHDLMEKWQNYTAQIKIDASWNRYYNQYKNICRELNLEETDNILFGLASKNRFKELKNTGENQRICLTPLYQEQNINYQ